MRRRHSETSSYEPGSAVIEFSLRLTYPGPRIPVISVNAFSESKGTSGARGLEAAATGRAGVVSLAYSAVVDFLVATALASPQPRSTGIAFPGLQRPKGSNAALTLAIAVRSSDEYVKPR